MEQISASLDGELSPEEERALQEHLAECADCRAAMAFLRSMSAVMREDTAEPPEKLAEGTLYLFEQEKKNRGFNLKRWRFTAVAAVICLALFGVVKLAPWSAGSKTAAAPMNAVSIAAKQYDDASAAPADLAGGAATPSAEACVEEAEAPAEPAPAAPADMGMRSVSPSPAQLPAAAAPEERNGAVSSAPSADEGEPEGGTDGLPGASAKGEWVTSTLYAASALPGYSIYSQLEEADAFYSVCFVYGEVPETIRTNRECAPLQSPEGQERWLVPLSVCLNEGLLEQFNEIYYGDLLSQQGLVIGILDMEEEQWQP